MLLTNIRQFSDMEVVLLFTDHEFTVPTYFKNKGCSVFVYQDKRDDTRYIPSVRPWLLWQYLAEDRAREQETYFYIDSDVIFREWIDFATLGFSENTIVGSSCDGYIGLDYILQCKQGPEIAAKMADITGITVEQMRGVTGIGAHIILDHPTAAFWERAYHDSNTIYRHLLSFRSDIQAWTAEMWAQQWGWVREGKTILAPAELNFIMSTDPIEKWDEVKILHNAGVTVDHRDLFYKGDYLMKSPLSEDLSWVNPKFASKKYADAIQKVLQ